MAIFWVVLCSLLAIAYTNVSEEPTTAIFRDEEV
jgi:hypothetical protein